LFVRSRNGAVLNDHGRRFVVYASQLVECWDAARRELPLPAGAVQKICLGADQSLWNPMLLRWVSRLHAELPSVALRAEVGEATLLHRKLEQGALDAAIVHLPEYWQDVQVEQLCEEKLIMVRAKQGASPYVFVDWGEEFVRQHDAALPQLAHNRLAVNLGPLALRYLLEHGGSGYFRTRVVQRYLDEGIFEQVPDAPQFAYPLFVVYARNRDIVCLDEALRILREVATSEHDWSQGATAGAALA
jgi:DNA-binding transcriptional LysR family regulator